MPQPRLEEMTLQPLVGLPALVQMRVSALTQFVIQTHDQQDVAQLSMQMFYALQALGQHDFALDMQARALTRRRLYRIAGRGRASIRLLALMGPGNMLSNTPLDFLTEHVDVQLDLLYLRLGEPLPEVIPDHDVAIVALGESDQHRNLLLQIESQIAHWPRPVLNHPQHILNCGRERAYELLRDVAQILVPRTRRLSREQLGGCVPPFTIRPLDTHAGEGLERIETPAQLQDYLHRYHHDEYFVSQYVESRSPDGLYRKMRVALIDGRPYACHLAISDHWIVHYIPAGMHLCHAKRAEEQDWMESFDNDFAKRHAAAFEAIARRLGLDYVVLDCAQASDGRLLVFEADSRAWVHASEPVDVFAYKRAVMQKAFDAFESLLLRRCVRSGMRLTSAAD